MPSLLLALVSMVLEGISIKDQTADSTPAALPIAQMLKFNSIKHKRTRGTTASITVRHTTAQETLVPMYVGMTLHAHARKRELVDKLSHLDMSILYDRFSGSLLRYGTVSGKSLTESKWSKMRSKVFATAT